jgi:hypothetical protein
MPVMMLDVMESCDVLRAVCHGVECRRFCYILSMK